MDGKYRDEIRKRTIRSAPQVGKHHGEGPSDGAQRNARVAAMVADRKADSKADKEQKIADRTAAAEKRRKETLAMAKEENLDEVRLLKPTKTFDRTELNAALKKHNEDMKRLRAEISAAKKAKAKAKPVAEEEDIEESFESSKVSPTSKHRATVHYATTWQKEPQKKTYRINKDTSDDEIKRNHYKLFGGRIDKIERHVAEETGTEARTKIKNVARLGDPAPTSEKSTLAKTGEIKVKKVDEEIADSLSRKYGLTDSLIEAAKAIVAKKTQVDMEPKTDDKVEDEVEDKPKGKKKLDPVGKEDDDVDNDGDSDESDKYLKNRRKAIGKAMKESRDDDDDEEEKEASKATVADFKKKMADKPKGSAYDIYNRKKLAKEEEQIDELKKSTLASYISKASDDATKHSYIAGKTGNVDTASKASQRIRGIATAAQKLAGKAAAPAPAPAKKPMKNPAAAGAAAAKADDAERTKLKAAGKKVPASLTGKKKIKEEAEQVDEAIKPYVSFTSAAPGRTPSATVMGPNEKPHKVFSKAEHGHDYKEKALDYFKKNFKKIKEDVEQVDEVHGNWNVKRAEEPKIKTTHSFTYEGPTGKRRSEHSDKESAEKRRSMMLQNKEKYKNVSAIKVHEDVEQVDEVLSKKAPAGEWIKDFQKSDNPKFAGKSPEKRKQMALAAYYAKQRNEEVEEVDEARSKEGYQTWPGQKKKSFFSNKAMDDETRKWKERKDAERAEREKASMKKEEVEQVDEARSKMRDYDSLEDRMKDAPKPGHGPKYNPVTRRPYKPGEPESAHTYATHRGVMQSLKRIKQHRKTHPLPEEVEEIDEISNKKLWNYSMDAKGEIERDRARAGKPDWDYTHDKLTPDQVKRHAKRNKGLSYAAHKLSGVPVPDGKKIFSKEEFSDEEVARLEEIAKQFD